MREETTSCLFIFFASKTWGEIPSQYMTLPLPLEGREQCVRKSPSAFWFSTQVCMWDSGRIEHATVFAYEKGGKDRPNEDAYREKPHGLYRQAQNVWDLGYL